jgi:hypothetical protein
MMKHYIAATALAVVLAGCSGNSTGAPSSPSPTQHNGDWQLGFQYGLSAQAKNDAGFYTNDDGQCSLQSTQAEGTTGAPSGMPNDDWKAGCMAALAQHPIRHGNPLGG